MDEPAGSDAPSTTDPVGDLLAVARRSASLSQEDLAAASGVSIRTIQGIEGARGRIPHASTIGLLAAALGLSGSDRDRLLAAARAARVRQKHPPPASPVLDPLPGLPPILGRDPDLAAIHAALAAASPLLTLLGPGGVGKTRLAREVADRSRAAGRHVLWVPLDAIVSPDLVLPAIARAAGVPEVGPDPLVARIAAALAPLRPLLVIDNAEHLLAAAPDLAALLRALPAAQFLVTSREPLRLAGERVHHVAPLALPDPLASPAALALNPAVALLTRSLAAAAPDRAVAADLAAAAAIVRLLDGLPLAIELAAAQGVTLPLPFIASLLETRGLDALAPGPRDAPARLQTMQAAADWSADLLSEPARRLLRLLGAFRGGWSVEGLLAVASRLGEPGLVSALPRLAESQLVQPDPGRPGRLRMLEPIRMYAAERLRAAGEEAAARAAHAAAYLAWASEQASLVAGPDPLPALDALDEDLPNLLAAFEVAIGPGGDLPAALQAAADLAQFWEIRGRLREGRSTLASALAAAAPDAAPSAPLMEALYEAGYLAYIQTDLPAIEEARARLRPLAAAAGIPEFIGRVAILDVLAGELAGAPPAELLGPIHAAHAALDGSEHWLAWLHSLILASNLLVECGDVEAALPLHHAYADWAERRGQAIYLRSAHLWLGIDLLLLGRPEEARRRFLAALEGSHGSRAITPTAWSVVGIAIALDIADSAAGADDGTTTATAATARSRARVRTRERAARLHGAFDADRDRLGLGLTALQARLRDESRGRLAASLGDDRFAELLAEGRAMPPDEVLALARS